MTSFSFLLQLIPKVLGSVHLYLHVLLRCCLWLRCHSRSALASRYVFIRWTLIHTNCMKFSNNTFYLNRKWGLNRNRYNYISAPIHYALWISLVFSRLCYFFFIHQVVAEYERSVIFRLGRLRKGEYSFAKKKIR